MKTDYDEISPITGNKCVLVEEITPGVYAKLCFESGYNTTSHYNKANAEISTIEENFPKIIQESRLEDEHGFYWYLSAMNLGTVMLYPENTESGEFVWAVVPVSSDPESPAKFILKIDNAVYFEKHQFEDAFNKMTEIFNSNLN